MARRGAGKTRPGAPKVVTSALARPESVRTRGPAPDLFRALAESAPIGIYLADATGDCTYANPRWLKMAGLTLAEALGSGWTRGLHPDDRESIGEKWYRAAQSNGAWGFVYRFQNARGVITWVYSSAAPLRHADGTIVGYVGANVDITARKLAEERLSASEERLRTVISAAHDGIIVQEASGRIVGWNSGAERIFGVSADEAIGQTSANLDWRLIREDGSEYPGDQYPSTRTLATGQPVENELLGVCRAQGGIIWINASTSPLFRSGEDTPWAVVITCADVSDLRRVQDELARTQERYATVADFTWDWEYWRDVDGALIYSSPSCERITGFTADEFLADPDLFIELVHQDDRPAVAEHLRDRLSLEDAGCHLEFRVTTKSGETRWIGHECRRVFDRQGGLLGVRGSNRDITEQRQAVDQVRESEERLALTMDATADGIWDWNIHTAQAVFSPRYYTMLGYEPYEFPQNYQAWQKLIHPGDIVRAEEEIRAAVESGGGYAVELRLREKSGDWLWVLTRGGVVERDAEGHAVRMVGTHTDISKRKREEEREQRRSRALEMASAGAPLADILTCIVESVEREAPSSICSILLLDEKGKRLAHGAAPSLPDFFNQAMDGLLIGESVGSCGTAAFTRQTVIVEDVQLHPFWASFRELAERAGVRSSWSMPIVAGNGDVLGTFAIYHREPHLPDASDIERIALAAEVARVAIERARAEEQLRESRERLDLVIKSADLGTWEWDILANVNRWDDTARALYGGLPSRDGNAVEGFLSLIHPDDRQNVERAIHAALEADALYEPEFRVRREDGSVRHLAERGRVYRDDDGHPVRVMGVTWDITERRQAEEAQRRQAQLLDAVLDSPANMPVFALDSHYRYLAFNDAHRRGMLQTWKADIAEGLDMLAPLADAALRERTKAALDRALGGEAFTEIQEQPDTGIVFELKWQPIIDQVAGVVGLTCFMVDITEWGKTEEALRESERFLRESSSLLATAEGVAHVGSWRRDLSTQRVTWSDEMFRLFAVDPAEFDGDPLPILEQRVHPDDLAALREGTAQALETEASGPVEYRLVLPDGSPRIVRGEVSIERDEAGSAAALVGYYQDITDIRQAEQRLRSTLHETVRALGAVGSLRDPYTGDHQHRVTDLADAIAAEMGLDDERREGLRIAGDVHDVGKIGVPAEILSKPGKLSEVEFHLVSQHSERGYEILQTIDFNWPVAEIVHQHHERLDGSGYPCGLQGDQVLLEARILAVADVVEAMASHRPYRAALGLDAALKEIRDGAGTLYDAVVVAACQRALEAGIVHLDP